MIVPPALTPGARIRVIAPSSAFDRTLALRGIGWLAERYRVEFSWQSFARDGFLAGSDERRLAELDDALQSEELCAIAAARGGYGLTRIAHLCDWQSLRARPKWIIGFSDVTALHVEAQAYGVCSIHADNVAALGRGDARSRELWQSVLEAPGEPRIFSPLAVWRGGFARGPLCGGNLSLLFACQAAGRLRLPAGGVLAIEDVSEAAYRVDRMLSALLAAGTFDGLSAVLVGDFDECGPSRGVSVEAVLRERLGTLRVPVLAGLRFGHGRFNEPLVFGLPATVDGESGELVLGA